MRTQRNLFPILFSGYFFRLCAPVTFAAILLCLFSRIPLSAQEPVTASQFLDRAIDVLPIEKRYDYHQSFLTGSIHTSVRHPSAQPTDDELAISKKGWSIVVPAGSGSLAKYACKDTVDFLRIAMQVETDSREVPSLAKYQSISKAIVAGTPQQFSGVRINGDTVGQDLRRSKDYELAVDSDRIVVCGYDDAGVMHGLFNLQSRMTLREAPFVPRDLQTTRHSRYQTRMVLSWLGWMQWPDNYLAHLAHDGYDAIYASVYANPNGVPGPPHYDLIRTQNAKKLNDVIRRAKRYGIRVIAPILFNNTGEEDNKAQLREHVRDIVTKFPEIRGYILLTEGFYYKKFFGAGGHGSQDLKEWAAKWTEAVAIVAEECHRIDPEIEVLPWEYNIDFRPHRVEIKRHVVSLLPQHSIPLLTWENGTSFKLDGFRGYLRDYSISRIGPAEVAKAQIVEAKRRGMKVYCKVDCFATWQFGTTPYLACPQQWQRRYDALAEAGIDGTLETWSNGYKPNFVANLRCWSCWTDPLPTNQLLSAIARTRFGEGSEQKVIQAWQHFSEAIQLVPDTGPSMGTNNAVAHPLFFDEPPPRIMTLHNSWWDEEKKTPWRHRMVAAWPYCHRIMVFYPDFRNKLNRAEQYARARSGISAIEQPEAVRNKKVLPAFNKHVLLAADEFERGLKLYRQAAWDAPAHRQKLAFREVLVVEQIQRMLRGLQAILQFEDLRFRLASTDDLVIASQMLGRMEAIVREEIERTKASLETARRDSRLGYEAEMDYVYTPMVLKEKLDVLHETLTEQIPAYRGRLK